MDSCILLGKLYYAQGLYTEALKCYESASIETLEEKVLPRRGLKIMAEAFAIKAMCTEKLPATSTSKQKQADRENNIIRCYELASDLTILFLQTADKSGAGVGMSTLSMTSAGTTTTTGSSSPVPPDYRPKMGSILEASLYQVIRSWLIVYFMKKGII